MAGKGGYKAALSFIVIAAPQPAPAKAGGGNPGKQSSKS